MVLHSQFGHSLWVWETSQKTCLMQTIVILHGYILQTIVHIAIIVMSIKLNLLIPTWRWEKVSSSQ